MEALHDIVELAVKSAAGYDLLSDEYYLPDKHPTCANFTALQSCVSDFLQPWIKNGGKYLEVGCGIGQLDLVANRSQVVLTDLSEGMLAHARKRTRGLVPCQRMNVFKPNFPDQSFDGIAAFVADAYNHPYFYQAIRKVIMPGGFLFVTIPNHIWATALRDRLKLSLLETVFIVRGEQEVTVPSITRPVTEQVTLLSRSGYDVIFTTTLKLNSLQYALPSEHIRIAGEELGLEAAAVPLLDLYMAIKNGT